MTKAQKNKRKLNEWVSVKDFGAAGNGVADDTAAIQAAINSLPTTGGTIDFPLGIYKVSSGITVLNRSNVRLLGRGFSGSYDTFDAGVTILGTSSAGFTVTNGVGVTFENLQLRNFNTALSFVASLGFRVFNCNLRNNQVGLTATGNGVGTIKDCFVRDNTLVGLRLLASSGDTIITGCDIGGNAINVLACTGNVQIHHNHIFSSKNSGFGVGVWVDGANVDADSVIRRVLISGNLLANNDIQVKVTGSSSSNRDVQDIQIHDNHIHQADDGGEGFDSGFAYGQGILIQNAKRIHVHHNNIIGCRDYGVLAQNCFEGVFIDHNHFRAGNSHGVVFDTVQWGRIDNNEFVSNVGTAVRFICTLGGNFTQNNRVHGNSFQSNGAIYTEDANTRANFVHDNLGGVLGDFSLSSTAPVSQLRHITQGGNTQTANQTIVLSGSAWNGTRLLLGTNQLWVDGTGRLRIKGSAPVSDTDGTVVGTQT